MENDFLFITTAIKYETLILSLNFPPPGESGASAPKGGTQGKKCKAKFVI